MKNEARLSMETGYEGEVYRGLVQRKGMMYASKRNEWARKYTVSICVMVMTLKQSMAACFSPVYHLTTSPESRLSQGCHQAVTSVAFSPVGSTGDKSTAMV